MTSPTLDTLTDAQFVQLTTYRRSGAAVPTAVWSVPLEGGGLGVWTPGSSGKVKRIRHSPGVALAVCSRSGEALGPSVTARAEVLDAAGTAAVRKAVRRKYRVLGWVLTTISGIRYDPVGVRITLG